MYELCDTPVDTLLISGSCLQAEPDTPVVSTLVVGLPDTYTWYLLRVTTRLTTQLPGNFQFFIIGDNTVGATEPFPGAYNVDPNPASDKLTVQLSVEQLPKTNFQVTDALGRLLIRQDKGTLPIGVKQFDLDVSKLPPGIYNLMIQSDKGNSAVCFIKE
jgi:hypothetical protein